MRIAITGATGSLGRTLVKRLVRDGVDRLVCLSRDEVKKHHLQRDFGRECRGLRAFLGDVRDYDRLVEVFHGCEVVVHAAALKRVESGDDPGEMLKTNVVGTMNVVKAACAAGANKVLVISSDKAVQATNFYGMTKAVAETYAVQSNTMTYPRNTRVAAVRYGNVLGSRGSVIEKWRECMATGQALPITDETMSRFWLTLDQAATVVFQALAFMKGGEVFVPRLPAATVGTVVDAVAEGYPRVTLGVRPGGEKYHERLLSPDEVGRTLRRGDMYIVTPAPRSWDATPWQGEPLPDGFLYDSGSHDWYLDTEHVKELLVTA